MSDDALRRRVISAAQWLAARGLSEGLPPTRKRIAATLGCDDSAVYARAGLESWRRLDYRRPLVRQAYEDFMELALGAAIAPDADEGDDDREDGGAALDRVGMRLLEGVAGGGEAGGSAEGAGEGAPRGAPERAAEGAADGTDGEDGAFGDDPVMMLERGTRFLARRLGRLIARGERGGMLNRHEIDSLTALGRMMERWETLAKERANEEEDLRDDQIAQAFRTINERILRMARAEAERLVAQGHGPEDGAARH